MDIDSAALVVIDMPSGFVNRHSRHAVPAVADLAAGLVARWSGAERPLVFAR